MAPMTRPGWVQCSTCGGTGYFAGHSAGKTERLNDCPDCVGGEVPGDDLVDAAGAGWGDVVYDGTPAWWLETRAALIAARRWEEQ